MSTTDFIIETVQKQRNGQYMACLKVENDAADQQNDWNELDPTEWKPLERLLVDSDQQHLIYVIDVDNAWRYIRFPTHVWPILDRLIAEQATLSLDLSASEQPVRIELTRFSAEGKELVDNMENNANYGEELATRVAELFPHCLKR